MPVACVHCAAPEGSISLKAGVRLSGCLNKRLERARAIGGIRRRRGRWCSAWRVTQRGTRLLVFFCDHGVCRRFLPQVEDASNNGCDCQNRRGNNNPDPRRRGRHHIEENKSDQWENNKSSDCAHGDEQSLAAGFSGSPLGLFTLLFFLVLPDHTWLAPSIRIVMSRTEIISFTIPAFKGLVLEIVLVADRAFEDLR